jgi:two-component system nitrogen regulation sensor histidine kinase NtrY
VYLYDSEGAQLEAPETPVWVLADRTRLTRALTNLLRNALESNDGASVDVGIRVFANESQAIVEVWDTGKGIDPDRISRIFEPKFTTKTHGLGLGLAMVRAIVKGAKGEIRVKSERGQGTVFSVSLPLSKRHLARL